MSASTQKAFNLAFEAFRAGNLTDAERHFKKVLQDDPMNLATLNLLAVVLTQQKKFEEAEQFFKSALNINSGSDATLYNYGIALKALNRPIEALDHFSQALAINPSVAETWNNRGAVLNDLQRYKEAISDFDKAIALKKNYGDAFCNKGKSFTELGQYAEALACYDEALTIKPNLPEAWLGRGIVYGKLKRFDEAFDAVNNVMALKGDVAEAWSCRGMLLAETKQYDEAWAAFQKALALNPNLADAWLGCGNLLCEINRHQEALAASDKALASRPNLGEAWLCRGNAFRGLKQYDEAFAAYEKALALYPDSAEAWTELGRYFGDLRRHDKAFSAFEKALGFKPELATARFNDGFYRLLLGDTERGWKGYESRWDVVQRRRDFSQPLWLGDGPLADKVIFIHAEQGLGDTLMACRYVPLVAALGAKVILEVQPPLRAMMENLQGVWKLVTKGEPIPHFDIHCPIMSLPLAFKTRLDSIPREVPYLTVPQGIVDKWRSRLGDGLFKVGIAWAGNPDFNNDRDRSIMLKNILPVCGLAGARYFSVQRDLRDGDAELLGANRHIVHLGNELNDFQDTAAVMMSLDLVISSDTSVVNLAGALGRPVWILLSFNPDWRWLLDRDDSPWYPTARLFRQTRSGDWNSVVAEVRAELEKLFASRRG